ncbi:integrase core domain-containing protein [Kutzneria sp. NPDC051319]|uniref:integrase core domain-containing protein n=1 Tax=Kutzneria sp. NPDC051319 TaxID=3155047 RepID=UPI003429E7EB
MAGPGDPQCRPQANCYAERFVGTVRSELTNRMLVLNRRHLGVALAEYVRHYNGRRPHRSRELRPPRPTCVVPNLGSQRIKRQRHLGGLINEYERAAKNPWSAVVTCFWNPTATSWRRPCRRTAR